MGFLQNLRIAADTGKHTVKQLATHPVQFTRQLKKYAWPDLKTLLLNGFTEADREEVSRRLEICSSCEFVINKETEYIRCSECSCSLKWKGKLKAMHCEKGKW